MGTTIYEVNDKNATEYVNKLVFSCLMTLQL